MWHQRKKRSSRWCGVVYLAERERVSTISFAHATRRERPTDPPPPPPPPSCMKPTCRHLKITTPTQPPVLEQWEEIVEGEGMGCFRGNVFGQRGLADGTAMTTAPVDVSGRKIQDQVRFSSLFMWFEVWMSCFCRPNTRGSDSSFHERQQCILLRACCNGR